MEHFELNELKQHAANLALIVDDRERRIAGLDQAIAERDGQIASLNHAVAERGGQIASLNQAIAERDGQIAGLKQATSERDGQVASLNKAELERDGQLVLLSQTVAGRDQEIAALRNSTSWRITKPLRFVSGLLRGKRDQLRVVRARGLKRAISLVKRPDMAVAQELDQLPNGFDPALYLKLNPDVADAGGSNHSLFASRSSRRPCFFLSRIFASITTSTLTARRFSWSVTKRQEPARRC
ncbi:hypothetical protein ACFS07_28330 [Undibacterium arcticum]